MLNLGKTAFILRYTQGMTGIRLEEEGNNYMATHTRYWIIFIVALLVPFNMVQAESEGEQELLFFLSGGPTYHQVTSEDGVQENDFLFTADILYSYLKGDFRFLAEYVLSTHESELERLQFGWQFEEETIAWLGRFHSPARYWNSAYHHGQYLQTSITRPLIEKFEDEGGIVATHTSGLMLESTRKLQDVDAFQALVSLGKTAVIDNNQLTPFDLLDTSSENKAAVALRLAYLPDQLDENQFGLTFNWSRLVVGDSLIAQQQGLQSVDQSIVGAYVDWRSQGWRILANLTYLSNLMKKQTQEQTDTFYTAYFQAEYEFNQAWRFFGRIEDTSDEDNSEYLMLFQSAIIQRKMLGLRFDFYKNQALTLELSNLKTQSVEFDQAWLQWSAVFP